MKSILLLLINYCSCNFNRLLNDSVFDSSSDSKKYLKLQLLDNLNSYYPERDQLEVLRPTNDFEMEPSSAFALAEPSTTNYIDERNNPSNGNSVDNVREWRKRLYRAFKNRANNNVPSLKIKQSDNDDETKDSWKLFLAPKTGFNQDLIKYKPKDIRFAYRTAQGQSVAFLPTNIEPPTRFQPNTMPMPAASYLVTSPPPLPVQVQLLSPDINPQYTTMAPQLPYNTFAPEPQNNRKESCEPCEQQNNAPSDEKCNSDRLKNIILNNIVINDAESSKRAVQYAAETETGLYIDAICGTGFFSYIAHTDEFCLASSGGVICYVFAPICSQNNKHKS